MRRIAAAAIVGAMVLTVTGMAGAGTTASAITASYDTVNCGGVDVPSVALSGLPSPDTGPYLDANPMCGGTNNAGS